MTRQEFLKAFPALVRNYRPTAEATDRIKNVTLVMVIGPSGVGKSSVIDAFGITFVPSDTSREPRPGEKEGQDFFFLNDYGQITQDIKAGKFLQTAVGSGGDFYATRTSSYPKNGFAAMPVMSDVVHILRNLGFQKTISAFIVPPTYNEWARRLKTRPITDEQLTKRLAEAKRSLHFALNDDQVHFILNDDLVAAVAQLKNLLAGSRDTGREAKAKNSAKNILARLN